MEITNDDALALVEKLNGLDLSDEEREVLGFLLVHDGGEVEGFERPSYLKNLPPVHGFNIGKGLEFNIGMPPTKGFNIGMPPT